MLNQNELEYLSGVSKKIDDLAGKISALNLSSKTGLPASLLGQYPGKPVPFTEGVMILADWTHEDHEYSGTIEINQEGPFIAQRIHATARLVEAEVGQGFDTLLGLFYPVSADGIGTLVPMEFYWEYSVSGSHKERQNIPVGSSSLQRSGNGYGSWPLYSYDIFEPGSTVKVKIIILPDQWYVENDKILYPWRYEVYFMIHGCYVLP